MTLFGFVLIREKTYEALHRLCADLEVRLVQFERRSAAGKKGWATRAETLRVLSTPEHPAGPAPAPSVNGSTSP